MKDERINLCFPGEQKILLADGNKIDVDSLFIELQKDIPDEYYTWSMNNKGKFIKNKIISVELIDETWNILSLNLTNGDILYCTLDQEIGLKTGEFIGASIFPMDKPILRKDKEDITIFSKTQANLKKIEKVYLIKLEEDIDNLTLFNGIVVKTI